MELKKAIKVSRLYVTSNTELAEALDMLIATAELVEAMRGKLIVGENQSVQKCIDDCAAAYIANMPTVEEIECRFRLYKMGLRPPYNLFAKEAHALLVSKIRGEK